jgi:hypothetical protein
MKHAIAHPRRNAAILGVVAVAILAVGADVALPYHVHIPIALAVLAVAAYLALHDRIHSVAITHQHRAVSRIPPDRRELRRIRGSRPSHLRDDRPGWL